MDLGRGGGGWLPGREAVALRDWRVGLEATPFDLFPQTRHLEAICHNLETFVQALVVQAVWV